MSVVLYVLSFGIMAMGVCLVGLSCMALIVRLTISPKRDRELGNMISKFIPAAFIAGVVVLLAGFTIGRLAE